MAAYPAKTLSLDPNTTLPGSGKYPEIRGLREGLESLNNNPLVDQRRYLAPGIVVLWSRNKVGRGSNDPAWPTYDSPMRQGFHRVHHRNLDAQLPERNTAISIT